MWIAALASALLVNFEVAPDRTISADEQVIIIGPDLGTRAAALSVVSEMRDELRLAVDKEADEGNNQVRPLNHLLVLELFGQPGDPAPPRLYSRRIRPVEGLDQLRFELNIHLARGLDRNALRREVLTCLLLDLGLKTNLLPDQQFNTPPWLIEGLLERLAWRKREADRGLYKSLYRRGAIFEVEDILTQKNPAQLNAAERTAFRISSGALVMAMLRQERGRESFTKFLEQIATFEGEPILLLRQHFPETALSENSLAKWWALQLENLTQDFVTETLDLLTTETALQNALRGTIDDEEGNPLSFQLENYHPILELEEDQRLLLLSQLSEQLGLLSYRCFPSCRPLILEYAKILQTLAKGQDDNLTARFTILREERELFQNIGLRTRDYLDWFQISTATELSGDFNDYLSIKAELDQRPTQQLGPIESYLESIQKLYE
ncbi:MAG: hypothetical protein AAGC74_08000 [Verrucomicrobiota bacterium]